MGQCGCCDNADYKLPGPDGITYEISIIRPCRECGYTAGIRISKLNKEDVEDFDTQCLPDLDFQDNSRMITVVDFDKVIKKVKLDIEYTLDETLNECDEMGLFPTELPEVEKWKIKSKE